MYGRQSINQQKNVVATTYDIVNDTTGVFSYLFRIIHNALNILKTDINTLHTPVDTHIAE